MKKPEIIEFKCDVYNANIVYLGGCKIPFVTEYVMKRMGVNLHDIYEDWGNDERNDGTVFLASNPDQSLFGIWCRDRKDLITFTHELTHLADEILNDRGVPISYENGEARAYLCSSIFEKIMLEKVNGPRKQ